MGRKVEGAPQWMIIYDCRACGADSGMTELQRATCFQCGSTDLMERERSAFTPEALAERMKLSAGRMLESLKKAFDQGVSGKEETMLLQALAQAKEYKEKIYAMADEMAEKGKSGSGKLAA
ncbi:MAG TPA: hypothetical protein VJB60_02510 [Candidatus Peribacterales bacterium]|nr:hypothetical protein [Candidatus Peribacterales bacterium]